MTKRTGYSGLQIALHWTILVLIGVNYFVSEGMEDALDTQIEGGTVAFWPASIHVYVGLAVFVLALVRLAVRLIRGTPPAPDSGPGLMRIAGEWNHRLLYALMVAVPFLGAVAWYRGVEFAAETHVALMNLMLILAGVHAAAALYHQYVLKDGLLARMMRSS